MKIYGMAVYLLGLQAGVFHQEWLPAAFWILVGIYFVNR